MLIQKPPVLTLDVSPLLEPQWTGIPVFARRLAQALLQSGALDLRFAAGLTHIPTEHVMAAIRQGTGLFLREAIDRDPGEASSPNLDAAVLYPSVKGGLGLYRREASIVHDMSTLFMPENHTPENVAFHLDHFMEEISTNDRTFCVSEATRAALLTAAPSHATRTDVVYQYVDWPEEFEDLDRNLPPLRLGRYAAVIGTIEPRKNLGLLLRALPLPELRDSDLRFVVIGKKGWLVDEFLSTVPANLRQRIIFSGFVTEFVKYRLLRHASFLVFPSVYEGFGIPAVEAMSLGKPVLAARTSSFPEVIGDCGVYFDPFSPNDFACALTELDHPDQLSRLGTHALEQSKTFNGERMARPIIDWIRNI